MGYEAIDKRDSVKHSSVSVGGPARKRTEHSENGAAGNDERRTGKLTSRTDEPVCTEERASAVLWSDDLDVLQARAQGTELPDVLPPPLATSSPSEVDLISAVELYEEDLHESRIRSVHPIELVDGSELARRGNRDLAVQLTQRDFVERSGHEAQCRKELRPSPWTMIGIFER